MSYDVPQFAVANSVLKQAVAMALVIGLAGKRIEGRVARTVKFLPTTRQETVWCFALNMF
jgi:hypothetical protein